LSTEERLEALETQSNEECIFCHKRNPEYASTRFRKITDEAVRKQFIKHGYTTCDHKQVGMFSVYYSDFLADKLFTCVQAPKLDTVSYDDMVKAFNDKEIMIPLIEEGIEPNFVELAKDLYK